MIKLFKYIALAEGTSYLILFFNMIFIKHSNTELYKTLLFPFGMTHGLLFVSYILLAFSIKKQQDWSTKDIAAVQIASLLPFATFYVEKKYLKNA
jgi:integral membrane protein